MKRRGFTLIELMVVIAIIIILAAIAIPNYLTMTARAKKSRVASDFAALATALETYRTDWNQYPVAAKGDLTSESAGWQELAGTATSGKNIAANTTASGDQGPIVYMTANILTSMKNPYDSTKHYKYFGSTTGWTLSAATNDATAGKGFLVRQDTITTLSDAGSDPNA